MTSNVISMTKVANASLYNTPERLDAACKEHTAFTPGKIAKHGYLVLEIGVDVDYDYSCLANQPRIYNLDDSTVSRYKIQCRDGVDQAGETIVGIRSAITVAMNPLAGHKAFIGLLGHHRFQAAKDAGCKYIVANVKTDWNNLTFEEKQDFLMTDNAHKDNGKQNSQASVKQQLSKLYSKESDWMVQERQRLNELQNLYDSKLVSSFDLESIEEEMKSLQKKLVDSKVKKIVRWMDKTEKQAKGIATNIFNSWRQTHEAGIDGKLSKWKEALNKDRLGRSFSELYVEHKIAVKNDSIMINAPYYGIGKKAAEHFNTHGDHATFTVYIGVPSGIKSVKHLFEIRKGYYEAFENQFNGLTKVLDGNRQNLKIEYKFIGQVLKGKFTESIDKFYDLQYVNAMLNNM